MTRFSGSASNLTRFVTMATKRAGVAKRAATGSSADFVLAGRSFRLYSKTSALCVLSRTPAADGSVADVAVTTLKAVCCRTSPVTAGHEVLDAYWQRVLFFSGKQAPCSLLFAVLTLNSGLVRSLHYSLDL